jgi:hypothetical protein
MTIDEFFRKLPRTGWKLTPDGAIRACKDGRCPLERRAKVPAGYWKEGAGKLGMGMMLRATIVWAADGTGFMPTVRARLLRHCGLAEKGRK